MSWFAAPDFWFARLVFERGLAAIYAIAFTVAGCQFRGLLGTRGLLPIPRYLRQVSWRQKPSLFHFRYSDRLFAGVAWTGAALGAAMAAGLGDAIPLWGAMLCWLVLWGLYASIVNVGQVWYGAGNGARGTEIGAFASRAAMADHLEKMASHLVEVRHEALPMGEAMGLPGLV